MMQPFQAETVASQLDREIQLAPLGAQTGRSQGPVLASLGRQLVVHVTRLLEWLQKTRRAQLDSKRLRLCESISLGEKRAIFLVQVDGRRFLLGGAPASISMLAQLDGGPSFPELLTNKLDSQRTAG
jgi:flagellar biogenesis protein FliO